MHKWLIPHSDRLFDYGHRRWQLSDNATDWVLYSVQICSFVWCWLQSMKSEKLNWLHDLRRPLGSLATKTHSSMHNASQRETRWWILWETARKMTSYIMVSHCGMPNVTRHLFAWPISFTLYWACAFRDLGTIQWSDSWREPQTVWWRR